MALCGLFAGMAGAMDVLGWQFRVATNDIQVGSLGYIGIAVALLGRNTAIGTCAAALLFGALLQGTSTRNLDPAVFDPSLAQNLTYIIQGLVILLDHRERRDHLARAPPQTARRHRRRRAHDRDRRPARDRPGAQGPPTSAGRASSSRSSRPC